MARLIRHRDSTNRIGHSPEVCYGGRSSNPPLSPPLGVIRNSYLSTIRHRLARISLMILLDTGDMLSLWNHIRSLAPLKNERYSEVSEFERMANEGSSGSEYTMVRKDLVLACCICSICNQIIRNPTTIIECLHIFCHQCIHDKIVIEKWQNCPKCYKFIGTNPLSKIRPNPLKMCLRDPLCEHEQQENPKHKVIEESSSSSTAVALDLGLGLGLGLGASNVPTAAAAAKTMITTKKRSSPGILSNRKAQTGCSKQGKGKAPQKVVLNFDLNFPPLPKSPPRPYTIVFALPSQPVNIKRSRSRRLP